MSKPVVYPRIRVSLLKKNRIDISVLTSVYCITFVCKCLYFCPSILEVHGIQALVIWSFLLRLLPNPASSTESFICCSNLLFAFRIMLCVFVIYGVLSPKDFN